MKDIVTIYINLDKKDIIVNSSPEKVDAALISLYIASFMFLLLGICGIYGVVKNRRKGHGAGNCFLGVYFIGILIFLLAFGGATIFFFVGPEAIFGSDCTHGSKTSLIEELYELNNVAKDEFCS